MELSRRRPASDVGETPGRRDSGSTFVELVIAITLLAIVAVPTLRAVITSIQASTSATAAAEVETALLNAVDRVNRSPADRCDYQQFARATILTQGWGEETVDIEHAFLDSSLNPTDWSVGPDSGPACPAGEYRDDLIQQVAITVTSPNGKVSRTIKVVKSNV
ncbi:MAG: hypothetical protein HOI41_05530 [Acidimicrobiaceae bacterium]|nr:hypothetical protein [Acidimicrobiaceae bacterium]